MTDTTGPYSFRLVNYAAATTITPGTPVSDTLNPATETDIYKINVAAANSTFFFDVTTGLGNATWRLIDPFGNLDFSSGFSSDVDTVTLPQPGTYFLVIEGRRNSGNGSASYAFNVVPDLQSSTPLTLGSTVNASLSVPGESDSYTFTLASAGRLNFDVLGDFPNFNWSLVGPGGAVLVNNRGLQSSDSFDFATPFLDLAAGAYTLTIDGTGDVTGLYNFRLQDFASATAITPGTPVNSTLNPATETDLYKFNVASANSKFYFDVTTGISNATWRLVDTFGNVLFNSGFSSDVDTLTLPQAGTYFLVIEGRRNAGAGSVAYAFNIVPDAASSTPLTLGTTVNSLISVPGESDDYTFNLASATRIAFDSLTDSANFQWSLTGPGGAIVSNRGFQNSDSFDFATPFIDLAAGNYTLTVDGVADGVGAYSFRLLNYADATPLTPGTPVIDTLNPATETDIYEFNVAAANSKYYFDVTTGVPNATWRLVDTFGNVLFNTTFTTDVDTLTLRNPELIFW